MLLTTVGKGRAAQSSVAATGGAINPCRPTATSGGSVARLFPPIQDGSLEHCLGGCSQRCAVILIRLLCHHPIGTRTRAIATRSPASLSFASARVAQHEVAWNIAGDRCGRGGDL